MNHKAQITLKKPSAIIHMEHRVSLTQEHLWNTFLKTALVNFEDASHRITFSEISKLVPALNTVERAKQAVASLVSVEVRYNLFHKDKGLTKEGSFVLIAGQEFDHETRSWTYSLAHNLKEAVKNSTMYSRLDLLMQRKYKGSKYGWILYELCFDFKGVGKTAPLPLSDFRRYLGLEDDKHKEFKTLNRDVIKPGVKDCNSQTDIEIKPITIKEGRKVVGIQFSIIQKPEIKPPKPKKLSIESNAYKEMIANGISGTAALKLYQKHGDEHISLTLEKWRTVLTQGHLPNGSPLTNPAGFLRDKIEKGDQMSFDEIEGVDRQNANEAQAIAEHRERMTKEREIVDLFKFGDEKKVLLYILKQLSENPTYQRLDIDQKKTLNARLIASMKDIRSSQIPMITVAAIFDQFIDDILAE